MLQRLTIKDYALIEEMAIDFDRGLNILTGETGAGKSIIIGAFSLLLGERAKAAVIRKGADKALVEGLFHMDEPLAALLRDHDVEPEESLLLRREVMREGRSRAFANDTPITNNVLTAIGDMLIDLHGQHDHQALLKTPKHIQYLDQFGVDGELLLQQGQAYKTVIRCQEALKEKQNKEQLLKEKEELLAFQVRKIEEVSPVEGEDDALLKEEKLLNHSERLLKDSGLIRDLLYDGEGSASERLSAVETTLNGLTGLDDTFQAWVKECKTLRISIEELVNGIQAYLKNIDFDPARLEAVRERLGQLSLLKKKYGGSLTEVLEYFRRASEELAQINSMEEEIGRLRKESDAARGVFSEIAQKVSRIRQEAAKILEDEIVAAMKELGLKNAVFQIQVSQKEDPDGLVSSEGRRYAAGGAGMDRVSFHISVNPGEDVKPLAEVASGGEISRIMLAIKTVLAHADNVPVLVFDEIDNGISGRTAWVVGERLRDVAENHHVICITHLPQIASRGRKHFSVEKRVINKRSVTTIRPLKSEERIVEIAKLIGGETLTEASMQSARELLES